MDYDDVLRGLCAARKSLPCRLLWDARGAELFAQICELDEYYLTRHELALLEAKLPEIAAAVGRGARVIEPGSGLALKTRMLLGALEAPASYVTIEVEPEQLAIAAAALRAAFPALEVTPICGDYMQPIAIPPARARTLVFFPGSTIGNFELDEAEAFLARFGELAGPHGMLLLGADSNADPRALVAAYDDREGVTAEFDRNVLAHLNRAYGATFDPAAFAHRAVWDASASRIEMHLVSRRAQRVRIAGEEIAFAEGEQIVTEHCYKYPPHVIEGVLARAGWKLREVFADAQGWMRLWLGERT